MLWPGLSPQIVKTSERLRNQDFDLFVDCGQDDLFDDGLNDGDTAFAEYGLLSATKHPFDL